MIENINSRKALRSGNSIPYIGLGVFRAMEQSAVDAIKYAAEYGYRHIDTAAFYNNEEFVGKGIKNCGVAREEIFLTTKIWPLDFENPKKAIDASLLRLDCDYVDLFLLHWPGTDKNLRYKTYEELLNYKEKGLIKSVGVSNFYIHHLKEMEADAGFVPDNNQIEIHPWNAQKEIKAYCDKKNISVTAWGPLFHGHLTEEPLMAELGEKYGKSAAQVTLRWHIQQGNIIIPKSVNPERIKSNAQIFDFEIAPEDMAKIDALDGKKSLAFNADTFDGNC